MQRTILLSLLVLLAIGAAHDACAQRRGGGGYGFTRGGYRFSRGRAVSPYGYGYAYLPYDYGYDYGAGYTFASQPAFPQPAVFIQQPPIILQPPAPRVAEPEHPVVTEYKWPAPTADSSPSDSESQVFAIVLKNGSTLSAVTVFASDDGLHYVDPDERHLRISMSEVDRAATLKLNRARNLNLYLPAPQ
jgi:hypothetical protein